MVGLLYQSMKTLLDHLGKSKKKKNPTHHSGGFSLHSLKIVYNLVLKHVKLMKDALGIQTAVS